MEQILEESFKDFFSCIVELYKNADVVYEKQTTDNIYRDRQHSVSSEIEDLFAGVVYRYLKTSFPEVSFCCMIDYRIKIDNQIMYPDIAVIVEETEPTLISYIDIKIDLGYNREYYQEFNSIAEKVKKLRKVGKTNRFNIDNKHVLISPTLKWRIAVVSNQNFGLNKMNDSVKEAEELKDYISLYFLSSGKHPNIKDINGIKMHLNFEAFFVLRMNLGII